MNKPREPAISMRILVVAALVLGLVPLAGAQEFYDTPQSLSVEIVADSQYVYKEDGYTVVLGEVQNGDPRAFLGSVVVQARFYDGSGEVPLEVAQGTTILEVVPPSSKAVFAVRSSEPDPSITDVSVSLVGFDGSGGKADSLTIHSTDIVHGAELAVGGEVRNSGGIESNVTAHVIVYDGFEPPRVLQVESYDLGMMLPNSRAQFEFRDSVDSRAVSLVMLAESDSSYTKNRAQVEIPPFEAAGASARLADVTLSYTYTTPGEVPVGSNVAIGGLVDLISGNGTAYEYLVQVKESGSVPYVAFLGSATGILADGARPAVEWRPQETGLYFVETFLWDEDGSPIADRGPFRLILVS